MKQTFALPEGTRLHVTQTKPNRKKKGKERIRTVEVRLRLDASNDVLGIFGKHLKSALYFKGSGETASPQAVLDGVEQISDLPNLRFPELGPLTWPGVELAGYVLRIPKERLELDECVCSDFRAELVEGGTTIVHFKLKQEGATKDVYGTLDMLMGTDILCSIVPGESSQDQGSVLGDIAPLGDAMPTFRQPPAVDLTVGKGLKANKSAAKKPSKGIAREANAQADLLRAKRVVYANPADPKDTWNGKGKKPEWASLWVKSGRPMEQLEVKPEDATAAVLADVAAKGGVVVQDPLQPAGTPPIAAEAGSFLAARLTEQKPKAGAVVEKTLATTSEPGAKPGALQQDGAWPFPKKGNGAAGGAPPQAATVEGQTPKEVKRLAAAKAAKTRSAKHAAKKGAAS